MSLKDYQRRLRMRGLGRCTEKCARCGKWIREGETTGESGLYSPQKAYTLCEPCFFDEERETEERGTNNLPDTLAKYDENLRY